jgi:hypothetical protein
MTRVLLVGRVPEMVDYSDPALPQGLNAEKIRAGVDLTLKQMSERGWQGDICYVRPDESAGPEVSKRLSDADYDCVVIGAGLRSPRAIPLLEAVVNTVRRDAPGAAIAFNTRPEDSAEAAARQLATLH